MATWLLKTEPSEYSFADLIRDGRTGWSGVRNALALKHLQLMRVHDRALIYHTGSERRVVGLAEIVSDPYRHPSGGEKDSWMVDVVPVKALSEPVPLTMIKADRSLADSPVVRMGRLSVVPLSGDQWASLLRMARENGD